MKRHLMFSLLVVLLSGCSVPEPTVRLTVFPASAIVSANGFLLERPGWTSQSLTFQALSYQAEYYIRPGTVEFTARAAGYADYRQVVEVGEGFQELSIVMALEP